MIRLTWRKGAVLVALVLTKEERQALRKHWRDVIAS
jgi:hypothetical protein